MELTAISGIGEKTKLLFEKLKIDSVEDLIRYYPVGYDIYEAPVSIGELSDRQKMSVSGIITAAPGLFVSHNVKVVSVTIQDPTGKLRLSWFNMPYMRGQLTRGSRFIFHGAVTEKHGVKIMLHPEIYTPEAYKEKIKTLSPVYSLTKGLTNNAVSTAVRKAMELMPSESEYLPDQLVRELGLMDETSAVATIHFPKNDRELFAARKRLSFDEFFFFILAMRKLKDEEAHTENEYPMSPVWETHEVIERLPYKLTRSQENVWGEIETDLSQKKLMQRLLQGEVGSGKTILSFLAIVMAASNGYQSALMAPTEVLARQHFEKLDALIKNGIITNLKPVLLTGSMKTNEKRNAYEAIAKGEANTIIGTHALIEDTVFFKNLALVITDEQHRFGVRQRGALERKGAPPHVMMMSATPIPRTLGIILYGDFSVSMLDELPAKRLPVKSCIVDESFLPAAIKLIKAQAEAGHQTYVICPLIEPSEELAVHDADTTAAEFRKALPGLNVGLLHGHMRPAQKNEIMAEFVSGKINVLVSTTVIEVGVDVPNASVILIENSERFGLAALHQLRGRVGRGTEQSYCIFMTGIENDEIKKRLEILTRTNDGFVIAAKDFELRGPGDLLGLRQSGDMAFRIADIFRDEDVLKTAGDVVSSIMADDPGLLDEEHALLKDALGEYMERYAEGIVL